jgi:hypothetical protein
MNNRNIALAGVSVLVLIAAAFVGYRWFSQTPELTVYLRCEKDIAGNLTAAKISSNGEAGKTENFNLETVCKAGQIKINGYYREEKIQFTFERQNGEKSLVISEYGENIQTDKNGFYEVLKLTFTPPFIAKDKI